MFGYQGGKDAAAVERKRAYMRDAQRRWPFLTNFDTSTIKNELQLASIVKDRSGCSRPEAQAAIGA